MLLDNVEPISSLRLVCFKRLPDLCEFDIWPIVTLIPQTLGMQCEITSIMIGGTHENSYLLTLLPTLSKLTILSESKREDILRISFSRTPLSGKSGTIRAQPRAFFYIFVRFIVIHKTIKLFGSCIMML